MAQTKYKLPDDLKAQCVSLVRGYDRRVKLYHDRRYTVLHSSPEPSDGQPRGSNTSDSTSSKTIRLEKIEYLFDTKAMRAVEQAKLLIGLDMVEEQRRSLTDAIWDCCIEGRNFNINYYDLSVGKTNFYERRREFLYNIASYMDFL